MGRMNTQNRSSTTARFTTNAVAVVRSFLLMGSAMIVSRLPNVPITAMMNAHAAVNPSMFFG